MRTALQSFGCLTFALVWLSGVEIVLGHEPHEQPFRTNHNRSVIYSENFEGQFPPDGWRQMGTVKESVTQFDSDPKRGQRVARFLGSSLADMEKWNGSIRRDVSTAGHDEIELTLSMGTSGLDVPTKSFTFYWMEKGSSHNPTFTIGIYLCGTNRPEDPGFLDDIVVTGRKIAVVEAKDQKSLNSVTTNDPWKAWLDRKLLPEDDAGKMLPEFVERHLQPIPIPASLEEWKLHRETLRQQVLKITGLDDLLPAKWDLNITSHGALERDNYRIEKFSYVSYPGCSNAALLYIPKHVSGKVPGIVSISGHTPESKAADYVQQRNINLVQRGCLVLCYDYFGYGDRKTGPERWPTGPNGHHHRHFSYSRRSPTTLEILDAVRALDVLLSRSEVDPERIGFTGESGGSNSTYWISSIDPRVRLAVPVSSVTSFDYWIRGDINWDWHQRPPGIRRIADIGTLLGSHAPQPLVIISSLRGTDDGEFPLDEAEKSHQWARRIYEMYGATDRVQHYESSTKHGYQQDKREQLYAAVERWLTPPHPNGGNELPVQLEPIENLRCQLPENNLTFQQIFTQWTESIPSTNEQDASAQRKFLRERLGWPEQFPKVQSERIASAEQDDHLAEFWLIETESGITLPCIYVAARNATSDVPLTLVPGRDQSAVDRLLKSRQRVLTFDLRGMGETKAGKSGNWASMAGPPWPSLLGDSGNVWTNWSWFAGRPVPGQWAHDMVQIARFACRQYRVPSVSVSADNDFGWPALLAGAAEPELIAGGVVRLHHESLHDDLRQRHDRALADVPGILERLDVPQLRKLWTGGTIHVK